MTKVLVLYYSTYGHIEALGRAIAEGARSFPGTKVDVKRVPELMPEDVAKAAGALLDQEAPIAKPSDLAEYDAIIFGTPTRFGMMAAQMRNFLDQTGGLWAKGALIGKIGSVFAAAATQHGGQEATLLSFQTTLMHHGMVLIGLPYSFAGQTRIDEVVGGSPYGITTITGGEGERMPSKTELEGARFQGRLVAETAAKMAVGEAQLAWRRAAAE